MVSFPYYSHTIPISLGIRTWEWIWWSIRFHRWSFPSTPLSPATTEWVDCSPANVAPWNSEFPISGATNRNVAPHDIGMFMTLKWYASIFPFFLPFLFGFRGFLFFGGVVQPKSCFSWFFALFFWVSFQINVKDVGRVLVVEGFVLWRFPFEFWALGSLLSPFADFAWLHSAFSCIFFTLHDSTPHHHPFCSLNLGNKQNIAPHLFLSVILPLQSAAHEKLFIYHGPASLKARDLDLSNMKIGFWDRETRGLKE